MKKIAALVVGLLVLVLVVTAGLALFSSVPIVEMSPIVMQRIYFSVFDVVASKNSDIDSAYMKRVHQATRVNRQDYETPYTFAYTVDDRDVMETDSKRCKKCHGSMLQKEQGKPKYPIHYKMLNVPMVTFHCTGCHKRVDLGKRTTAGPTIRIDRTQCTKCHEASQAKGKKKIGKDKVSSRFLISNHGIDQETGKVWIKRHAKVAKRIGVKRCYRCHQKKSELDFCEDCHDGERLSSLP